MPDERKPKAKPVAPRRTAKPQAGDGAQPPAAGKPKAAPRPDRPQQPAKAAPRTAGKATPKPPVRRKPAKPRELTVEDDFLKDLGDDVDDVVSAPTREFSATEAAAAMDKSDKPKPKPKAAKRAKKPAKPAASKPAAAPKPAAGPKAAAAGEGVFDAFADDELDEEDLAADGDEDFADEDFTDEGYEDEDYEDEDFDEDETEERTGVLTAITGRIPRIPGRGRSDGGDGGGGGGNGGDEQPDFGRPRRRFPLWARFLTGSAVVIATFAAAMATTAVLELNSFASDLGNTAELEGVEDQLESVDGGAAQTIMIIGSDKRPEEIEAGLNGRSDTTILLRIDPDKEAISLFSIPRDLIVNIPGYGTDMFNAAYSIGGPDLTLRTVKELTGIDVNHLVNVNFRGFAKAVQSIGCVYVDVDRRYYHSNEGLPPSQQYSEIDVRPGYQRLCGYKALEYVRYRHGDNDVVRSARQQDFLREARARVPAEKLFNDRKELMKIFTDYTSSDIDDGATLLQVLKLFIEARDHPVKEIHFEGEIGNRVTTTPEQIQKAVNQFMGIRGSSGPRGSTTANEQGNTPALETPPGPKVSPEEAKASGAAAPPPKKKLGGSAAGLEGGTYGEELAWRIRRRNRLMPIYYPTTVVAGSEYAMRPRAYNLKDSALEPDETFSYKFTLKTPDDQYYGLQGTRFKDAPILDEPHETRQMGDREYKLYFDNDRLRMVAWENDDAAYWVSNSLLQGLTANQMIAIARGAELFDPEAALKKQKK